MGKQKQSKKQKRKNQKSKSKKNSKKRKYTRNNSAAPFHQGTKFYKRPLNNFVDNQEKDKKLYKLVKEEKIDFSSTSNTTSLPTTSTSSLSNSRKRKKQHTAHYMSSFLLDRKTHSSPSSSPYSPPTTPPRKKKKRKKTNRDSPPLTMFSELPTSLRHSESLKQEPGLNFLENKIEIPKIIKISQKDWPSSPPGAQFEDLSDQAYYKRHYRASV